MKSALIVLLAGLVALTVAQNKPLPLENIDVDNTLKNDKLVNQHIKCVLDKGRCDTNGNDLKDILPKVLNEDCRTCSAQQKANADKIVNWMKQNRAQDWSQISAKYTKSK